MSQVAESHDAAEGNSQLSLGQISLRVVPNDEYLDQIKSMIRNGEPLELPTDAGSALLRLSEAAQHRNF